MGKVSLFGTGFTCPFFEYNKGKLSPNLLFSYFGLLLAKRADPDPGRSHEIANFRSLFTIPDNQGFPMKMA